MIFSSSAIFAPLLLLLCLAQVVAANLVACQKDPVIVYLDRGQKITISYWLGEEARHEVTELPKPSRRPTVLTKIYTSPYPSSQTSPDYPTTETLKDEENSISQSVPSDQGIEQNERISSTTIENTISSSESPWTSPSSTLPGSSPSNERSSHFTEEPQSESSSIMEQIDIGTTEENVNYKLSTSKIFSNTGNDIINDDPVDVTSASVTSNDIGSKEFTETISTVSYDNQEEINNYTNYESTSDISESKSSIRIELNDIPRSTIQYEETTLSTISLTNSERPLNYESPRDVTKDLSAPSSTVTISSSSSQSDLTTDLSTNITPDLKTDHSFEPFSDEEYVYVPEDDRLDVNDSEINFPSHNENATFNLNLTKETGEITENNILTTLSSLLTSLFKNDEITNTEHPTSNEPETTLIFEEGISSTEKSNSNDNNRNNEITKAILSTGFSLEREESQTEDSDITNQHDEESVDDVDSENVDFEISSESTSTQSKETTVYSKDKAAVPSEWPITGHSTSTDQVADETIRNDVTLPFQDITESEKELSDNEISFLSKDNTDIGTQPSINDKTSNKTLPEDETIEESPEPTDRQETVNQTPSSSDDKVNSETTLSFTNSFAESSTAFVSSDEETLSSASPDLQESSSFSTPMLYLRPNDETLMESILHQVLKHNTTHGDDEDDYETEEEDEDDFDNGGEVGVDPVSDRQQVEEDEEGVDPEEKLLEEVEHDEGLEVGHHEAERTNEPLEYSTHASTVTDEERADTKIEDSPPTENKGEKFVSHVSNENRQDSYSESTPVEPVSQSTVSHEHQEEPDHESTTVEPLSQSMVSQENREEPETTTAESDVSSTVSEDSHQEPDHDSTTIKSQYSRLHPKLRPHGPRVYHSNRRTRETLPFRPNATSCTWIFKTEPGVPFLLTLKNYSLIEGDRCLRHHVAVERSNGYEARWCGGTNDVYKHSTFARHEVRLRFYTENDDPNIPEGFVVEIQALDMNLLRKAVSKVRPVIKQTKVT